MNKLKLGIKQKYGRNYGQISSFHRGGGIKVMYRKIDFFRNINNIYGKIIFFEQDSFRTADVMGVFFSNGIFSYMLGVYNLNIGDIVGISRNTLNYDKNYLKNGFSCKLYNVAVGSIVHNIEYFSGKGGKIGRSAGSSAYLIKKTNNMALLKLSSGELREFSLECMCTIGRVNNINHKIIKLKKAGANRWRGKRPVVRGIAMNPVDHPHGGRSNGGITPVTPWGKITRGSPTRNKRKVNHLIKKHIN